MNMFRSVTTFFFAFAIFSGLLKAQENGVDGDDKGFLDGKKVAIVYYAHSGETYSSTGEYKNLKQGNTALVAENIKKNVKEATLFKLETVDKYPEKYDEMTQYVKEQQEKQILPELKDVPDIAEYDVIFIGTPVWWGTVSLPVASFLQKANLVGKIVIPFITHEGSGESGIGESMQKASGCKKVLPALVIKGSEASESEDVVKKFIHTLKD